mmetsp:Transcript_16873/g.24721  ORF Transcript_16873/g.24721 Transcript_16873/m.24721 type:complete len:195 (-) Transcript_16873:142-726(-)
MSHPTEGGPRNVAAVKGLHNSKPYITRMGSSASKPCAASSPKTTPMRVTIPTIVMYTLVRGRIDLYFCIVSDTADFCSLPLLPFTLVLPVADKFELLEWRDPMRPFFFGIFPLEAPPRSSRIASFNKLEDESVAGGTDDWKPLKGAFGVLRIVRASVGAVQSLKATIAAKHVKRIVALHIIQFCYQNQQKRSVK